MRLPPPRATPRPDGAAFGTPGVRPTIDEVCEAFGPWILRAMRCCGIPAAQCEDAAQEVCIDLQLGLPSYDPSRPFEPWLMAVTNNRASKFMGGMRRHPCSAGPPEGDMEPPDTRPDPERHAEHREMERSLPGLIQKLPPAQREVFAMRFVEELPVPEVAGALGIPQNTVRSREQRARASFDRAWARQQGRAGIGALLPFFPASAMAWLARLWQRFVERLRVGFEAPIISLSAPALATGAACLLAVGIGGGAMLHATLAKPPPAETLPVAASADLAALSVAPPPSASQSAIPSPNDDPPPAVTTRPVPSAKPPASLRAENALIQRARAAIAGEKPEAALRALNRHEELSPDGALAGQRRELMQQATAALAERDGGAP